jgi:hypothetical protein
MKEMSTEDSQEAPKAENQGQAKAKPMSSVPVTLRRIAVGPLK